MKIPIIMLLHPVGIGATRAMNVLSAKLWSRALIDLLPEISFETSWITYAEVMVDRDRGIRDALTHAPRSEGAVAVGGDFSRGMSDEWTVFGDLKRARIDLTRSPMPELLTYETFAETRTLAFQHAVVDAFAALTNRRAAA